MLLIRFVIRFSWLLFTSLFFVSSAHADEPKLTVAVLQFGTLNWEMDVIKHHHLDERYNFKLNVVPVGSKNACTVALQSGSADLIYGDWVWVNRQRFNRRLYGFSPVSSAAGGVYLQPQSKIIKLNQLKDVRLGIAGGPVDKSWLLLQAYMRAHYDQDLLQQIEPVYAAPPLINKLMFDKDLSASLNFWHYSARLNAEGFRPLITIEEMIRGLGIDRPVPLVGWIFPESLAIDSPELLNNFLLASREARKILLQSNSEWERIKPLMRSENDRIFEALREGYRSGQVLSFTAEDVAAVAKLYQIIAEQGGDKLTGGAQYLDAGLFWMPSELDGLIRMGEGSQ